MINAKQFDAVMSYVIDRASSPRVAAKVWSGCLAELRGRTGEVMLTRTQLAKRVGSTPTEVSRVLSLLCQCGALIRHREGGGVAKFVVNSKVGTKLGGQDRERSQAEAPALNLPQVPNNPAFLRRKQKYSGVVRA